MICKKCNAELDDGAMFCSFCGERVALEQPAPSEAAPESVPEVAAATECACVCDAPCASKNSSGVLEKLFTGPYFIVAASFLSFWALMTFVSILYSVTGGVFSFLVSAAFNVAPLVYGIIALVAVWKIVAERKLDVQNVKPSAKFFSVMRAFSVAALIACCILAGLAFILIIVVGVILGVDLGADLGIGGTDLSMGLGMAGIGALILIVLALIIMAAAIVYAVFSVKLYAAVKEYYNRIIEFCESGSYDTSKKSPYVFMFVMAGIMFLEGAFLSVVSFFATLAISGLLVSSGIFFMMVEKKIKEELAASEEEAFVPAPEAAEV